MTIEVYEPYPLDGFELCLPEQDDDYEHIILNINGTTRASTWRPISMRLVQKEGRKKLAPSDAPWLGTHALIFKDSVIKNIGHQLALHGELLPLACAAATLFAFNPTRVIDALDEHASEVARFSSGRIMLITRYAFRPNLVSGVDMFKIPNLRISPTFVSKDFVNLWTASALHGLEFRRVWSE